MTSNPYISEELIEVATQHDSNACALLALAYEVRTLAMIQYSQIANRPDTWAEIEKRLGMDDE